MARISTYTIDSLVEGGDKLLGTDANSSSALATKNYTIDSLKNYILSDSTEGKITDTVPLGFFLSVNREGTAYEKSLVRTLASSVLTNVVLKDATTNTGCDIYLNTLGTGQVFLIIRDYNDGQFALDYDLADFATNSATFSGVLGGTSYSGTVTSFNAPTFTSASAEPNVSQYVVNGNVKYTDWAFNVTLNDPQVYTGGLVAFTEFTFLTGVQQIETQVIGDLKITRDLIIDKGDVVIGTDNPNNDPRSLTVHGPINVKDTESSIVFGDTAPNVTLATDGTNLTITGSGSTIISNDTRFTTDIVRDSNTDASDGRTIMGQNEFTAIATDGTRAVYSASGVSLQNSSGVETGAQIKPIEGNPASVAGLTEQGLLAQLQIGDDYFNLPELASGVASALPGLSEQLAGPSGNITMGRLFYGIRQSNGALFQATTSPATVAGINITAGETTVVLSSSNFSTLQTLFDATPANQALYFVEDTYTTAFPAVGGLINDTTVNMYQIVAENESNFTITFGKQGDGIMTISTSELNINSEVLKLNDIPSGTTSNYLFYNSATKAVSQSPLSILASANGATYDYAGNVNVAVNYIDFDNLQITAPANGQVVIKQGYAYGGALTSSATADIWKLYILSNISADSTLTLPAGNAGDSIKIVNMSAFDSNGNYVAPSFTWTINPNGSEKIMRASNLVLDESTSSFELYYADAANGWVINGIS
jgi:hypothetical protein